MSYAQAYEEIEKINEDYLLDTFSDELITSKDFNLMMGWNYNKSFNIVLYIYKKAEAELHACQTATEILLIKAQTGQYPGKLPDNTPLDPFSGKSFQYTTAGNGFILKSSVQDPVRKTIPEWKILEPE